MDYELSPLSQRDRESVVDIFNYYVENGFAAYPEHKLPYEFFDHLLMMIDGYPAVTVREESGTVVGFGFLRAHHPSPTFGRTAEITYFISPEHTRKGIGRRILEHFIAEAGKREIDVILANISSLNEQSLRFHRWMGFEECGRFRRIGRKFGRDFDVVWMQKLL
ncbi:MAG: GNAT family N-acetyltransferase [Candidatus Abyssubacteria bacterium]